MTKTKSIITLIFLIAFATGCRSVMLKLYGIKDPKIENRKTIRKKAQKFGLDTAFIVTVKSADFLKTLKEADGIPNAAIYDAEGSYIEYRATDTSCNAGLFAFIPELKRGGNYHKTGKTSLNEEIKKYNDLNGIPFNMNSLKSADFYVLIYWNVWTGRLNKDHVKAWENLAKQNKQAHIEVIKVNMDFQEYWDKAERDKIIDRLNQKK